MSNFKKLSEAVVRIIFIVILGLVGFLALNIFSFIALEVSSAYAGIATNIFGFSLALLFGIYTYKEYKRLQNKE
jgi:hypothetical protein